MKKYIVNADISTKAYSTAVYLFGVFDTLEEALQFIKDWKPKRRSKNDYEDRAECFDFIKRTKKYSRPDETEEAFNTALINDYIEEFDGTPLCMGCYYE